MDCGDEQTIGSPQRRILRYTTERQDGTEQAHDRPEHTLEHKSKDLVKKLNVNPLKLAQARTLNIAR